jgi:CheY-like chemotaxis protein
MPPYAFASADPVRDDSSCPGNPEASESDQSALSRIRSTARSIEDRVRRALSPPGFNLAGLRFLIVDDHPDAADALAAVMELLGCPVRACYDGWTALRAAESFDPHVCLLDLKMPGMDGLELGARLKSLAGGKPMLLIATTALGDQSTRGLTAMTGFHSHLVKPVDVAKLVDQVAQLWQQIHPPAEGGGQHGD